MYLSSLGKNGKNCSAIGMGSPFSLPTFIIALGPKTQIAPINKNKKSSEYSLRYLNTDVVSCFAFSVSGQRWYRQKASFQNPGPPSKMQLFGARLSRLTRSLSQVC